LAGMRTSLHNAKLWGSDVVLLVPAVVNPQTSYRDAWTRSQAQIRKLIPLAEELKVVIAIEEVWNRFLLSPLEMVQYIGEFHSPWVGAWFDVGNVVLYGYPQDWIRTLGKRIVKVHLKDFKGQRTDTPGSTSATATWTGLPCARRSATSAMPEASSPSSSRETRHICATSAAESTVCSWADLLRRLERMLAPLVELILQSQAFLISFDRADRLHDAVDPRLGFELAELARCRGAFARIVIGVT